MDKVIRVREGLEQSTASISVSGRTTICDLMVVTTTSVEFNEPSIQRKKFSKSLNVALPYKKTHSIEEISLHNVTPFQEMRNAETIKERNILLKIERDEFMGKTMKDRLIKKKREAIAATNIQASFRGYCSRPRILYRRRPKGPTILTVEEYRALLCELTSKLNLSHIPGLTLKMKTKSSRQKQRVENAAAFGIQTFFKMLVEKRRAKKFIFKKQRQKYFASLHVLRRIIRKFIDMCRISKIIRRKRDLVSIKIQARIRMFLARR
jgi:hypothetical protein